jgi:non-heme chloroperoxidase
MHRTFILLVVLASTVSFAALNEKSDYFNTSDGVRLHYIEAGEGRPIVLIPGWTMPANIWRPQINALSMKYRVIALDPRSQGDSDKPAEGNYPERCARDIKELVDSLKLEKPVLVGWSLAAQDVLSYVDQFGTDNLGGVVLVDEFIKIDPEQAASFPKYFLSFQEDRRKMTEEFVKSMYAKPKDPNYLDRITEASLRTPTNSAMALIMGSLARLDWTDVLPKMANIPVQYHFEPRMQAQAELIKQKLPSAQIVRYGDDGHALFVDDAERFNRVVSELMDGAAK